MQKTEYPTKPPVAALDFNEHLRNAYWNAENSLNLFQAEGGTFYPGAPELGSRFNSKVAWEKFKGNVGILTAMIRGTPSLKEDTAFKTSLLVQKKEVEVENPDYKSREHSSPKLIMVQEEESEQEYSLRVFASITDLFHRKLIFKPPVTVFGGHL